VKQVGSRFHNVNALVYPRGPKASSLSEVVLKNLRGDGTLASPLLSVTTLTSAKISGITENAKFNPPDERFDQVQVFWYVSSALEWFEKNLG
ncbi:MAG: hypothetical protein N2578_02950, partial [Bdellovibrionaceae bacterium]|nr:hypothetical protein [Pseudobdellovibrionaceae bacterium]